MTSPSTTRSLAVWPGATSSTLTINPVNDAPVIDGRIDLGSADETSFSLSPTAQLLANASDVDGDSLSVVDLKVASGDGSLKDNNDGTFTFRSTTLEWRGRLLYGVSDGQGHIEVCNGTIGSTAAGADLTINPVNDTVVSGPVDLRLNSGRRHLLLIHNRATARERIRH